MINTIVTDIEGTTSSLSFVKDVLFPYAREKMPAFIKNNENDETVSSLIQDVRTEVASQLTIDEVIAQLLQWIDEDKKITPLKSLQGILWETGYKNGDFEGHIYVDAKAQLEKWHKQGIKLYVYSSGSVYAQKLLFSHTKYGDLTPIFSGYFDTKIGPKVESHSYTAILNEINEPANNVLFLSDIKAELDAAKIAGMKTKWLVREGEIDHNAIHEQLTSFETIVVDDF